MRTAIVKTATVIRAITLCFGFTFKPFSVREAGRRTRMSAAGRQSAGRHGAGGRGDLYSEAASAAERLK